MYYYKKTLLNTITFLIIFNFQLFSQKNYSKIGTDKGFIENKGQIVNQDLSPNSSVTFIYNSPGLNIQLKDNCFSYESYTVEQYKTDSNDTILKANYNFDRVDVEFPGANLNPQIIKGKASDSYINYYTVGTEETGVTKVKYYNSITYENLYEGIDLEFITKPDGDKKFEYSFIVHPGADPSKIVIKYNGAEKTFLQNEKIMLKVKSGFISESIPKNYIEENGNEIKVSYKLLDSNTYAFNYQNYDKEKTLIIDPEPDLSWCTYFGGSQSEMGYRTFQTITDEIYLTGETESANNIATTGTYQGNIANAYPDAFLSKFDADGNLLWSTYYGGTGTEWGYSLALNSTNDIFLLAETNSTSNIATTGAHQTTYGGGSYDAFLAKFNPDGVRQWATYFGGDGWDFGESLAISNNDNIYVVGQTESQNGIATSGAYQTINRGVYNAYLAKFNSNGVLQWSTFYGGTSVERGYGLAISPTNDIYMTGGASSSSYIATIGAHQTVLGGSYDGFLAKFDTLGNLVWGTYFGGSSEDRAYSVQVSHNNNVYITGFTNSSSNISTPGAHQTNYGGNQDAFLAKFNSVGQLQWATYYGGSNEEIGFQIKISLTENIYMVGETRSTNNISMSNAYQTALAGGSDAFIAKFDNAGQRLWGTYFGGPSDEIGRGMHLGKTGNICITGYTQSTTGISTPNTYQTTLGGSQDAFLAKFTETITGIDFENKSTDLITIFPNPGNGIYRIKSDLYPSQLDIFTIEGQKVFSEKINAFETTLNLNFLSSGIYIYKLTS